MARIKIELPDTWQYSIDLPVRITDINYGRHVGNDSFLAILHEARFRWLRQFGWTELELAGAGLIMVDVAIRFKAESNHDDVLRVQLAARDWTTLGFDLYYLVSNARTGAEVCRAQTGMIFYDYNTRKVCSVPDEAKGKLARG